VAISGLVAQTIKYVVGRERPFVAELPLIEKKRTREHTDNNLSFYSQHTNLAFSLVFSFGTIAHLRKYQAEHWIWALGLPAASLIGYSRIASQKHYLSDVLVGAGMGAFTGWLVPWLHSQRALPKGVVVQGGPQGVVVTGVF
jgi:membrane-associated phospholipid phosphatase